MEERQTIRSFDLVSSRDSDRYGGALPPPPGTCEHCGKTLYWRGISYGGIVPHWWFVEPCDCQKAVAAAEAEERRRDAEKKAQQDADERKRRQDRIDKLIGQSGIGKRFTTRTFDAFIAETDGQRRAFEIAKNYAASFSEYKESGTGIVFAGSVGTGKTHLAAAITLYLMHKGTPVIFRTGIDLFADIRAAYSGRATEGEITSVYKTVDLLVIDDFGKEKMTEWAATTLFSIFNARYENMLPTVITTNLDKEGMRKVFGDEQTRADAVISRMRETSIYVPMVWDDQRRRKRG